MTETIQDNSIVIGSSRFATSRPHRFGLVIDGPISEAGDIPEDYLSDILLAPGNHDAFLELIAQERLVVCKNVRSDNPTYRRVRGKSSVVKLSQAEYYHHDGCSSPTKPRIVEIRCPHQAIARNIATAIAPFPAVIRAMLTSLPETWREDEEVRAIYDRCSEEVSINPDPTTWDTIQGRLTRMARRKLDAEACRSYFRRVDQLADAYVLPWEMGESRLMLNDDPDLTCTMQHRRSYQRPRESTERNGSLVKRWLPASSGYIDE